VAETVSVRSRFDSKLVRVGTVVGKVALGQGFPNTSALTSGIITLMPPIHIFFHLSSTLYYLATDNIVKNKTSLGHVD
jgi:hypothetical protein